MAKFQQIDWHSDGIYGYAFFCPGCKSFHQVRTDKDPAKTSRMDGQIVTWDFNGDVNKPTISPSLLVHEYRNPDGSYYHHRCHTFIKDGQIQFLSDCTHALAGQTVDIPEWISWKEEDYGVV